MKTFVYYNLHRNQFSVKALEGPNKGRVVAHCDNLVLHNVRFVVSEAGRTRVLRQQRKNVHAGLVGDWLLHNDQNVIDKCKTSVTYDPYKYTSFVCRDNEQPISCAPYAWLINKKVFVP